MKSLKTMKNEKFHCSFNFMLFKVKRIKEIRMALTYLAGVALARAAAYCRFNMDPCPGKGAMHPQRL